MASLFVCETAGSCGAGPGFGGGTGTGIWFLVSGSFPFSPIPLGGSEGMGPGVRGLPLGGSESHPLVSSDLDLKDSSGWGFFFPQTAPIC